MTTREKIDAEPHDISVLRRDRILADAIDAVIVKNIELETKINWLEAKRKETAKPDYTVFAETFRDGMSLRDWFAGQALLSAPDYQKTSDPQLTASWSYTVADAMLAEREKQCPDDTVTAAMVEAGIRVFGVSYASHAEQVKAIYRAMQAASLK